MKKEKNKICDLEYYIKYLVIDFKIGDIEKNSLDDLIKEIRIKNKGNVTEDLFSYLKETVQKINLAYNEPIEENYYFYDKN